MRRSLYFIAAALFAIATGLALWNDGGVSIKTLIGAILCGVMIWMGLRSPANSVTDD